jgi:hypothetical protein
VAQLLDYAFRHFEALLAADCRLHGRVEVLHAHGHAGDPGLNEGGYLSRIHVPRIDFHGELGTLVDAESIAQGARDLANITGGEDVGRTPAPVDVRHRMRSGQKRGNADNRSQPRADSRQWAHSAEWPSYCIRNTSTGDGRKGCVNKLITALLPAGRQASRRTARPRCWAGSAVPSGSSCSVAPARHISWRDRPAAALPAFQMSKNTVSFWPWLPMSNV